MLGEGRWKEGAWARLIPQRGIRKLMKTDGSWGSSTGAIRWECRWIFHCNYATTTFPNAFTSGECLPKCSRWAGLENYFQAMSNVPAALSPPAALPLPEGEHLLFRSEKDRICKNRANRSTLKATKWHNSHLRFLLPKSTLPAINKHRKANLHPSDDKSTPGISQSPFSEPSSSCGETEGLLKYLPSVHWLY